MASPHLQPVENPSYEKLKRELDDDVTLLNFLPYKRATFQRQCELEQAAADRILYGDMMEEKDQLWIYFTLHQKGKQMISFYTLKAAQQGQAPIRPCKVKEIALASWPFKHARDHFQIMAIAKYFFIRRGIDVDLKYPLSGLPFKDDLLGACRDYKGLYNQTQTVIKDRARTDTTGDGTPSVSIRAASRTASTENSRKRTHSSGPDNDINSGLGRPSPQSPSPTSEQPAPARLSTADRENMVDQYILLRACEEELSGKIAEVEKERSEFARQMAELQADLNAVEDRKWDLEEEKDKVRSEKKRLQSSLEIDDQLEFGFEAGRKMESKRARLE